MKRLLACLILLIFAACSNNPPANLSPEGKRAYQADQVVNRLGEFQQVVIDLSNQKKIPEDLARKIVTAISGDSNATPPVLGIVDTLNEAPVGWQNVARTWWNNNRQLALSSPALSDWVSTFDQIMSNLTPMFPQQSTLSQPLQLRLQEL